LANYTDFYEEMTHFQKLNAMGIPVNLTYFTYLKNLSLVAVIMANITLIVSDTSTDPKFSNSLGDRFILILGLIVMITYLVIGGLWFLFNSQIDIKKVYRLKLNDLKAIQKIESHFSRSLGMFGYFRDFFFSLLINSYLFDLVMNISFAMLGVYYSKVFLTFLLLDIIQRSDLLKNVIKAVT
jgi:hypothetical protein